jgi:hypothetical protein
VKMLLRGMLLAFSLAPLVLAAVVGWTIPTPDTAGQSKRGPSFSRDKVSTRGSARNDSLVREIETRAPFRANRRPVATKFRIEPTAGPAQALPLRPVLVLKGILWGPDPVILLDGLPQDLPQRLFRTGDTIMGLRVRKISRLGAVISGQDTTWELFLQKRDP